VPETCVTASSHGPAGSGDNRPGVGRRARQRRRDLRHTGGTLAATTDATIKELMARLGQFSPRAAMIYQHATSDRDKLIAPGLGKLADAARPEAQDSNGSGPSMAHGAVKRPSKCSKNHH
jgi:hypothetical protein